MHRAIHASDGSRAIARFALPPRREFERTSVFRAILCPRDLKAFAWDHGRSRVDVRGRPLGVGASQSRRLYRCRTRSRCHCTDVASTSVARFVARPATRFPGCIRSARCARQTPSDWSVARPSSRNRPSDHRMTRSRGSVLVRSARHCNTCAKRHALAATSFQLASLPRVLAEGLRKPDDRPACPS